ncbi:MAG: FAD-dependent oxidoreductase [Saccharofermentanales bacterium]
MKKIIVLGAGYSGVLTAKKLAKKLKNDKDVEISIIDKHRYHTMLTELHEVAGNRVEEDSIRISLSRIFAGRKVKVITDTIESIDYEKQVLKGSDASYEYDYLVLASGSKPAYYGIPGACENTLPLWSYDDAVKLKQHVFSMFSQANSENDPAERKKLLTFYVAGAGFTGVEMAGELAEWVPQLCDQFEVKREEVKIVEVDLLNRVVPVLPEKLSDKTERRLRKMGVDIKLKTAIVSVGEDYIEYKQDEELYRDTTRTVIWTAGTECADVAQTSAQLKPVRRGRIEVDEFLRAKTHDNVYVAGDNMFYMAPGSTIPVPQMVENCEHSASTITNNLLTDVKGSGEKEKYDPKFHGVMVSIGGRYGVANVGGAKKKINLPSFFAMFVKHFINIIYFVQVLGWNKVFGYMKKEFFTIRNRRSFVGGHFSNRTPSFLLVPLRVFLGFIWVLEGVKKLNEGWLNSPKLFQFFQGANQFFENALSGGADANAGATAAEGGAATVDVLVNWNIFGIIKVFIVNAADVAAKIQFTVMDWFVDSVILANGNTQLFFQTVIVISEILIGLALIAGLFTFLASGYSIVLQVMFLMTTGLYMGSWWMIFAAVAVLIAGGHVFGLDYYVIPWLKRQWKKIPIVRKSYLYND